MKELYLDKLEKLATIHNQPELAEPLEDEMDKIWDSLTPQEQSEINNHVYENLARYGFDPEV